MTRSTTEEAPTVGSCAADWEAVRDAFDANFATRGEIGASLCVIHRGQLVVDLAGGWGDEARSRLFQQDDLVLVFSTTKAMTAIAAHILADRGLLDLNARVADYWPEYAANGKAGTTVAMVLDHSAGVPGFRSPLKAAAYLDAGYMVERIAAESPLWEPGTQQGYHLLNYGWMVGELVRRISGRSLGRFFREEVADPLSADFWIGLPATEENRVVDLIPPADFRAEDAPEIFTNMLRHPTSPSALALANGAGFSPSDRHVETGALMMNSREAHAAEIGAAGGVGSARGVARVFAALAGDRLLSADHVIRMSQTSARSLRDVVLLIPTHFSLGFMKSMDNRNRPLGAIESFIIGERAIGHVGMGGSFGFYDVQEDLAVGYVMNRLGQGILLNNRGQALIDAIYTSLEYRTNAPGVWVK